MESATRTNAIAIIGIGCRFPGRADTPELFWKLLCEGTDAITEIPRERFDVEALFDRDPTRPGRMYSRWGGFIEGIESFDAEFFGISPREARRIDPQQRLLLEVVWEAMEDAALAADRLAGSRTGVFIGISSHDYGDMQVDPRHRNLLDAHASAGSANSVAANRISYFFDFRGPSLAVDTACSSSLVAMHLACQSLVRGESALALVGGVNAFLTPETPISFCKAGMLSPDGRCKAFDSRANGFVRGEGAGVVLLRPLAKALEEGDPIHAVILGSAVNHDGRTPGMMVPGQESQEAMLREALVDAEVVPASVHYVEAHGTGTAVGDPIEARALGAVLSRGRPVDAPCLIGSVKTNIGHLEAGAGIAGLIKATLALEHREIPPSLHLREVNPEIPMAELRLRVPTSLEPWPETPGPARAGVNSFGFGGANAHVVLEEPPPSGRRHAQRRAVDLLPASSADPSTGDDPSSKADRGLTAPATDAVPREFPAAHILPISARAPAAARELAERYRDLLRKDRSRSLAAVCRTAATHRVHHEHRIAVVAASREEMLERLDEVRSGGAPGTLPGPRTGSWKLAFVFSGMGPQWWGMGRQLLTQEPIYRRVIDECDRLLRPMAGWSLREELASDEAHSRLRESDRAQVANFAMQVALAALWRSWGIVPDAVVGHSAGEPAAACVAGALDLPDALLVACQRGRVARRAAGEGTLLAASVSLDDARALIGGHETVLSLAAVNGPCSVTLSGKVQALGVIAKALDERQIFNRFLAVDVPYHGPQLDPSRDEFLEALQGLSPRSHAIPIVSGVDGRLTDGTGLDAGYWWRNVRQPVLFADAVRALALGGHEVFVEISPHPVLAPSVRECFARDESVRAAQPTGEVGDVAVLPSARRGEDDRAVMLGSLAELYARGRGIEWTNVVGRDGERVPLPRYPWQRERHWFEAADGGSTGSFRRVGTDTGHPLLGLRQRSVRPTWETDLSEGRLAFLRDHRVQGAAIFPGAGYVEMALAAVGATGKNGTIVLEQIEFRRLLVLGPREETILHSVIDPETGTFEIHSARKSDSPGWNLHASARLGIPRAGEADDPGNLERIRERCRSELSGDAFYQKLEECGYQYSGAFRAAVRLWQGEGEALGRIELPDLSPDPYRVHPALLDAAFQVLFAAGGHLEGQGAMGSETPAGMAPVPVFLKRIEFRGSPGRSAWAHARVHPDARGGMRGSGCLMDEKGKALLRYDGLHLKATEGRGVARDSLDDCLFEYVWEPQGEEDHGDATAVSPEELLRRVRGDLERRAGEGNWAEFYENVESQLDALAIRYIRTALAELTQSATGTTELLEAALRGQRPDALARALSVAPQHDLYFVRLVEIVRQSACERAIGRPEEEAASTRAVIESLLAAYPEDRAALNLIRESGGHLAAVLQGQKDGRELLFSPDSVDRLERFYQHYRPFAQANAVIAAAIAALQADTGPQPVRILEVGAGTGGTTASILSSLPPDGADYLFTDVSPFFLSSARKRFGDRTGMRFEVLDIEQAPGGEPARDVVVAANVLHATADLRTSLGNVRRLLRPGGLLVLLEATRKMPWVDLIFGALDGWWRFSDFELRPDHPLLTAPEWRRLLAETGFDEAAVESELFGGETAIQAVFLARAAPSDRDSVRTPRQQWLILADGRGVAEGLAASLSARGDLCTLVYPGPAFHARDEHAFEISPARAGDWTRLLQEQSTRAGLPLAVLHLWALDAPPPEEMSTSALMEHQRAACASLSGLLAAVRVGFTLSDLWLVTAGSQAFPEQLGSTGTLNVAQATLWGAGRVLMGEHPEIRCRLVDLGSGCSEDETAGLLAELDRDLLDRELAFRGPQRYVRRLRQIDFSTAKSTAARQVSIESSSVRVEVASPGVIDSIVLREAPLPVPGPGEVLVRALASSLNFKDVLMALGALTLPEGEDDAVVEVGLGGDCSGVVVACGDGVKTVRPGDAVIALTQGTLASHVTAREELIVSKPPELSFAEAAAVPSAFVTAEYALKHLARLAPGERVLIHAAAGGVGLAAIEIAQRCGAEIFGTAGSPEKRDFVRSLGVEHVLDSRSLAFADEILRLTGGEGVDVVLNSLAGEAIRKGLAILRPFGRFLEIGKRDIFENTRIGLLQLRRNISFATVDLAQLARERSELIGSMMHDLVRRISEGDLRLPPVLPFGASEAATAFRFMAQARHIGRVVLTFDRSTYLARAGADEPLFRADASYLITGGLGGVGLAVASWMVNAGARHLVLMSRSGVPADADAAAFEALLASPAQILVIRGDAGRREDVGRVIAKMRATLPPIRGILHAAMVLDDDLLDQQGWERFERVLSPKIGGAWNLHQLTLDDQLDFFVLFSSIASVLGTEAQGNYAAANAFLDALAPHRRALGLPAHTVNWGAISDVGYVSRHRQSQRYLEHEGLEVMRPEEAVILLERVLRRDPPQTIVLRTDWSRRRDSTSVVGRYATLTAPAERAQGEARNLLDDLRVSSASERKSRIEEYIARKAATVLGTSARKVDLDRPLTDLGFDSLMAVELQSALRLDFGAQVGIAKLLQGTSLRQIAIDLLDQMEPPERESTPQPAAAPDPVPSPVGVPVADGPRSPAGGLGEDLAPHPLSHDQRRFWLMDQMEPGNPASNIHLALRFTGRLDLDALDSSVSEVLARHEVLRARYITVGGEPMQVLSPPEPQSIPVVDLAGFPLEERESEMKRLVREEIRRSFDLSRGPLFRLCLYRLGEEEHILLGTVHHIAFSHGSAAIFVREAGASYAARVGGAREGVHSMLPALPMRYADFVRWQRQHLTPELIRTQTEYWRTQLAGAASAGELPFDRPRPRRASHRGGHLHFELSRAHSNALVELSRREGATLFMTLLGAFQTLLHRYTGDEDITVGTAVANHGAPGSDALIGCFMNTLCLRTDLSGNPPFRGLLGRVRETALRAYEHQDVPFELLLANLRPDREPGRRPYFDTMMVLHGREFPDVKLPGLSLAPVEIESGLSMYDLMLVIDPGERIRGVFEYDADLFDPTTAERMLGHFLRLLEEIAADPQRTLADLPLQTEEERRLQEAPSESPSEAPPCLHEMFEAQADRTPDAAAVISDEVSVTYSELERAANQLAHRLRSLGVDRDVIVGICMRRSVEMVVAALGVMKAGGAYLPLDPTDPESRRCFMMEDAGISVLLTQPGLGISGRSVEVVEIDPDGEAFAGEPEERIPGPAGSGDLAYVLYTSGSAGEPKGVLIPHRAICNQVCWRQRAFPKTADDAILFRTPFTFDPSVWEIFGPLSAGARVVILPTHEESDLDRIVERIACHEVTMIQVVPSLLEALLETAKIGSCGSLRHVFCGGEVMRPELRDRFFSVLNRAELHNLYGPTETAIDATCWTCERLRPPPLPIGRPISNVRVRVLGANLRPVPFGVPGEIHIGGAGLARGYLNRPDLTAESFIPDPIIPSAILYRTGDLGRYLADGTIEFLGRRDRQIKIRGRRVELGEIEGALLRQSGVREAVVVPVDGAGAGGPGTGSSARVSDGPGGRPVGNGDGTRGGRGGRGGRGQGQALVAYLVLESKADHNLRALRRALKRWLPDYCLPSELIPLTALPRLPNGKLDRPALQASRVVRPRPSFETTPVTDPIELRLLRLWEDFFGFQPIGRKDTFFDLGGHSLAAARMVSRIQREFGLDLPLARLLEADTVEKLAPVIRRRAGAVGDASPVLLRPGSRTPLFLVHPTSGSVFCYSELARLLDGDGPVYGLQAPGFEAGQEPLQRIDELADHHLTVLQRIQPTGPYFLGGWSMGGVIAHEISRRLHVQGEAVRLLALLDARPWAPLQIDGRAMQRELVMDLTRSLAVPEEPLALDLARLWDLNSEDQIAWMREEARVLEAAPRDLDRSMLRRRLRVLAAHLRAMRSYVPSSHAAGSVLFEAGGNGEPSSGRSEPDPAGASGGGSLTGRASGRVAAAGPEGAPGNRVTVLQVPGTHYTMLRSPHVRILARELSFCLDRVRASAV